MFEGGSECAIPADPRCFPTTVTSVAAIRDKQGTKHNTSTAEYKVCAGVMNALKDKIVEAVYDELLEEINDAILGFRERPVANMFEYLVKRSEKIITLTNRK